MMTSPGYTRRKVLCRTVLTALGVVATPAFQRFVAGAERSPKGRQTGTPPGPGLPEGCPRPALALSLRVWQMEAARLHQARQPLPATLSHGGGMNRIHGFMVEPDGALVLLGERDPSLPIEVTL